MSNIDYLANLLITTITAIIILVSIFNDKNTQRKTLILFIAISIYFYSGFGISYDSVDKSFIIKYIIYLILLILPIRISNMNRDEVTKSDFYIEKSFSLFRLFALMYLFLSSITLFYPTIRLNDMFSFDINFDNIYARKAIYNSYKIIQMADTAKIFLLPFFLVYLSALIDKKKKPVAVILMIFNIYFEYTRYMYIGRYKIVVYGIMIFMMIFFVKGFSFNIKLRYLAIGLIAGLMVIPFLYEFTFTRLGNAVGKLSLYESIQSLVSSETYYPQYYSYIILNCSNAIKPATFVLWIICLPIPSLIWPSKPSVEAANIFTYYLTGRTTLDVNYSSSLPSLLGESFMVFGENFYWVHAIIVGSVIALLFRYCTKHKTMNVFTLYMTVMVLTIGRGGTGSYMSTIINGSFSLILYLFMYRYVFGGGRESNGK